MILLETDKIKQYAQSRNYEVLDIDGVRVTFPYG